jgi:geranylgeranyl reductase family protein
MKYDLIVVGAGPAGSTLAHEMARSGATVLLLDRARFPRDKPCGGGVTVRAARQLPFDLAPVTERTVWGARFSLRHRPAFERSYPMPLTYMTQRRRLDSFLVERACAEGVRFVDGMRVESIESQKDGFVVRGDSDTFQARAIAGADGANGIVAAALGLDPCHAAVALEANLPCSDDLMQEWEKIAALDLGSIPGGYSWVFPKGDHLNVGVGGWRFVGPDLRRHLSALCRQYGFDAGRLHSLRGHRLPLRKPGAAIVRDGGLLVGDAAGLVDPLSGEGIHTAIRSAQLAADALRRYLAGEAPDVTSYQSAVDAEIMPELAFSHQLQDVFHYTPGPYVAILRHSGLFWRLLCSLIRGDLTYARFRARLGPLRLLLDAWAAVARRHWKNARQGSHC